MSKCQNGLASVAFTEPSADALYTALLAETGDMDVAYAQTLDQILEERRAEMAESLAGLTVPGFSPEQQGEVLSSLLYLVKTAYEGKAKKGDGTPFFPEGATPQEAFTYALTIMKAKGGEAMKNKDPRVKYYAGIVKNWKTFQDMTVANLGAIGINVRGKRIVEGLEDVEEFTNALAEEAEDAESNYERTSYADDARFSVDVKDTASARFKLFLSSVPKVDKHGNNEVNFLGTPKFIPFDTLFDNLSQTLADTTDHTFTGLIEALEEAGTRNPMYKTVAKKLQGADERTKAEFVVSMSKHYTDMVMVLYAPTYSKAGDINGYKARAISSNQNTVTDSIIASWVENQKLSPLVKVVDGEKMIDRARVAQIKSRWMEIQADFDGRYRDPEFIEKARLMLSTLGIVVPPEAMPELVKESRKVLGGGWEAAMTVGDKKKSFINYIFNGFDQTADEGTVEQYGKMALNNALYGNKDQSVRRLARFVSDYTPKVHSLSFRDSAGKTIYGLQNHTHLSVQLGKLQDSASGLTSALLKTSFSGDSLLLRDLEEEPAAAAALKVRYLDGMKRQRSSRDGLKRAEMTYGDQHALALTLFQSAATTKIGKRRVGEFVAPTHSDKTTTPTISMLKQDVDVVVDNGVVTDILPGTMDTIMNLVGGEVKRISKFQRTVKARMEADDVTYGDYHKGAEIFYLFPYLNKENLTEEEAAQIWAGEELLLDPDNFSENGVIQRIVKREFLAEIARVQELWRKEGIVSGEGNNLTTFMDGKYLKGVATGHRDMADKVAYAAADMTINYAVFNTEYYRVIAGDPAIHAKRRGTANETVLATLDNVQKRLAKDIAPRMDGRFERGSYNKVTIDDRVVPSTELEAYIKLNPAYEAYAKLDSTDAQELTTLREHIEVMRAYGKIEDAMYDAIVAKIEGAGPGGYYELTGPEKSVVLQAMKPVAVVGQVHEAYDLYNIVYTKSSSYPLVPEMTRGMEIDNLRVAMERTGVDRLAHLSADKLGAKGSQSGVPEAYDADGHVKTAKEIAAALEPHVQVLSRDGFGIQQEVPVSKMEVLTLSQMNKLLFVDLRDTKGFKFEGQEFTGRDLEQKKEEVRKELFRNGRERLLKKMGVLVDENGDFVFTDLKRIQGALKTEALERGWNQTDLDALELTEDGRQFILPLSFSNVGPQIESLLLSMIKSEIIDQKMFGKSYVQASSAGWTGTSDEIKNSMVFVDGYDSSKGLRYIREENGEIKAAQIMLPFYFKDNEGEYLELNDFRNEDGTLDTERLPADLLRLIGARIPNQGHNSMIPMEIVGFYPRQMGSLAIVPDEITKQMGSDFDVDKLYTYISQYRFDSSYNKDGKIGKIVEIRGYKARLEDAISKIETKLEAEAVEEGVELTEEQREKLDKRQGRLRQMQRELRSIKEDDLLKQTYMDIHWSVLTHPEVMPRVVAPRDVDDLAVEAGIIQKAQGKAGVVTSPIFFRKQLDDAVSQRAGKQLVGDFSLVSTFNAAVQDANLHLARVVKNDRIPFTINFRNDKGQMIRLSRLSGTGSSTYNKKSRTKSTVIANAQDEAVDNAKNQTLDKINLNRTTAGVAGAMMLLEGDTKDGAQSLGADTIARFISQPAVHEFVTLFGRMGAVVNNEYVTDRKATAIERVIESHYEKLLEVIRAEDPEITEDMAYDKAEGLIEGFKKQSFSPSLLLRLIEDGAGYGPSAARFHAAQIAVMELYRLLDEVAEQVKEIRIGAMHADRNGADNAVLDALGHAEKTMNLPTNKISLISGAESLVGEFDDGQLVRATTELGVAAESSLLMAPDLFQSMNNQFFYSSDGFKDTITDLNDVKGRPLSPTEQKKVWRGVRQYVWSSPALWGDVAAERNRLMFGDNTLAHRILEAQATEWGKGNFLVQRLEPVVSDKAGTPSRIQYAAAKGERLDNVEAARALAGLLTSPDESQRTLALDLVRYAYLTGGVQDAVSFVKYISPKVLEGIGVAEKMRGLVLAHRAAEGEVTFNAIEFSRQYVQHNPDLAPEIKREQISGGKFTDSFILKAPFAEGAVYGLVREKNDEKTYPPYLMGRGKNNTTYLYVQVGTTGDQTGNILFERIDVLGSANAEGFGTVEYVPGGGMVKSQISTNDSGVKVPIRIHAPTPNAASNPKKANPRKGSVEVVSGPVGKYIDMSHSPAFRVDSALEKIENPAFRQVADLLAASKPAMGDIRMEAVDLDVAWNGTYRSDANVVEINAKRLKDDFNVERVILHELVHAATSIKLYIYEQEQKGEKVVAPGYELTASERAIISSLVDQLEVAKASAKALHPKEYAEFFEMWDNPNRDGDDTRMSHFQHKTFYPLVNVREYVAHAMTTPDFQKSLNAIEYKKGKTLFDRLVDTINNLLIAIGKEFGYEIKKNSVLEAAVRDIVTLMQIPSYPAPATNIGEAPTFIPTPKAPVAKVKATPLETSNPMGPKKKVETTGDPITEMFGPDKMEIKATPLETSNPMGPKNPRTPRPDLNRGSIENYEAELEAFKKAHKEKEAKTLRELPGNMRLADAQMKLATEYSEGIAAIAEKYKAARRDSAPFDFAPTNDLGMSVGDLLKTLPAEDRRLFAQMRRDGFIQTKC